MTLGQFLRQKREARRLSLRDMAEHLKADAGNLCRIENSEGEPSLNLLCAYARFLRLSQDESDLMYSLAGRLPPDIAPIELQRKGIYRFIRDNLPDAESHSRAFIAIGANAVGINQGKR